MRSNSVEYCLNWRRRPENVTSPKSMRIHGADRRRIQYLYPNRTSSAHPTEMGERREVRFNKPIAWQLVDHRIDNVRAGR